jgi:hypothetical protein
VPQWPEKVTRTEHARVQVWTYRVSSDQKSMSLRAPDCTVVELVETAAQ